MLDESAFRGRRLCVVGNVNRDVKTAPIPPGPHLFEDGETSADFVRETVGGGGANSALAAAALGADVSFAGKVGADAWGERLAKAMADRGVRAFLSVDPGNPTGTSINLVFDTGRRHFVSCLPSSATLCFEDVDPAALDGAEHLLRADVWFSEPMLFGGNEKLLRRAKAAGLATSIDLNWDPQWGRAPSDVIRRRKDAVRASLPLADLAHGNVRELCEFAEAGDLATALARLEQWGVGAAVVHMGIEGAGFYRRGELIREPCVPAPQVVNATGSGDVLSVCMMLLHGREDIPVTQKLRAANAIVSQYVEGRRVLVPEL